MKKIDKFFLLALLASCVACSSNIRNLASSSDPLVTEMETIATGFKIDRRADYFRWLGEASETHAVSWRDEALEVCQSISYQESEAWKVGDKSSVESCINALEPFFKRWLYADIPSSGSSEEYLKKVSTVLALAGNKNLKMQLDKIKSSRDSSLIKAKNTYNLIDRIIGIYNPIAEDAENLDINLTTVLSYSVVYEQKLLSFIKIKRRNSVDVPLAIPSLELSLRMGKNRMVCRHMAKVLADSLNYVFSAVVARHIPIQAWTGTKWGRHAVVRLALADLPPVMLDLTQGRGLFAPYTSGLREGTLRFEAAAVLFGREMAKSPIGFCNDPAIQAYLRDGKSGISELTFGRGTHGQVTAARAELSGGTCHPLRRE